MPFDALPEIVVSDLVKLRIARDGIVGKGGWLSGALGRPENPSHCVIGWLLVATEWNEHDAARLLGKYVWPALPEKVRAKVWESRAEAVYTFNDGSGSKERVVRLMNDAVKLAEAV